MEKQKRVLIIDSDEQVLIALERLLEDEGIETVTTCSALQALEMLPSHGFDVLLIGDHLADLTSEQLLREIQRQGVDASILVMESRESRARSSENYFESLGASGTVRKRDYGQLLHRLNMMAANHAAKHARAA